MGEFELIKNYFASGYPQHPASLLSVGDDCSLTQVPAGQELAISLDTQVSGVHFPELAPADLIAQRALRAAASDLATMGASPQAFHLSLTLPKAAATAGWLAAFSQGLKAAAADLNLQLLGGDTTRGKQLVIAIQVQGFVPAGKALTRSGAQAGEDVWLSGLVGAAGLGLAEVLASYSEKPEEFQEAGQLSPLTASFYFPPNNLALGQQLIGLATSCLDVSDGLLQDAGHIAKASGINLHLEAEKILTPFSFNCTTNNHANELEFEQEKWLNCFTSGEDFELLFTAPVSARAQLKQLAASYSGLHKIGTTAAKENNLGQPEVFLIYQGQRIQPSKTGWQHF